MSAFRGFKSVLPTLYHARRVSLLLPLRVARGELVLEQH